MSIPPPQTIELLRAAQSGEKNSFDQLFDYLNAELQNIAIRNLNNERQNHTLDPSALISILYEKLYRQEELAGDNRRTFLAICSRSMRQILIDYARKRQAARRGGGAVHVTITNWGEVKDQTRDQEILALNEAIEKLTEIDEIAGRLVELRFFGGMTTKDAAKELGITYNQARVKWEFAKGWLREGLGV